MACLRMSFQNWVDSEPEELETDRPTEEQLHAYEEAEKRQAELVSSHIIVCMPPGTNLTLSISSVPHYGTAGFASFNVTRGW
jgi:hypothetical protein